METATAFVPPAAPARSTFHGAAPRARAPSAAAPAPAPAPARARKAPRAVLRPGGRAEGVRQPGRAGGEGLREEGPVGGRKERRVFLVGKLAVRREVRKVEEVPVAGAGEGGGLFGVQAKAYWESMGVLPLSFAAFGLTALAVKMAKVKTGQWKAGDGGVNRATTHASIVTSEEELAELHVFKCGGCGYEMYPARGREFKHFGDKFKCPLCGTGKDGFWDLNDPDDPRNQEEEGDGDGEEGGVGTDGSDGGGGGGVTGVAAEVTTAVAGEGEDA